MSIYLNKLLSVLGDVQAKQLTSLLLDKKNSGEIQNLEELRAYMSDITNKVLSAIVVPSLELFLGSYSNVIDSETYNFMLARIKDDLVAAYAEIDNIDILIDNHINLINNVVLRNIELGLDTLEARVNVYEFLAANQYGLDTAISNTFKSTQTDRIGRSEANNGIYFLDPRTQDIIPSDITLDTVSERITLGHANLRYIPIKSIEQIFDISTKQSESMVSLTSNNINNVIDGSNQTYWTYSILQKYNQPEGVLAKFVLELSGNSSINFIEIEPAAIFNMELISVDYVDGNNALKSIPNINSTIIEKTRLEFASITTRTLFITFKQRQALFLQYENKNTNNVFNKATGSAASDINMSDITNILQTQISSAALLETGFFINKTQVEGLNVEYFDYEIGFDNIRVGNGQYTDASIFTSKALVVKDINQVALKANETRPLLSNGIITNSSTTYTNPGDGSYLGSIEYFVILEELNDANDVVNTITFPILPIQSRQIFHERLILKYNNNSTIPNAGKLLFYTRASDDDGHLDYSSITVYRNGSLLIYGDDWLIEEYPYTNDILPPSGIPSSTGIRILSPSLYDIYTVSYTPMVSGTRTDPVALGDINIHKSTSTINIVDLTGDCAAKMNRDNIVLLDGFKNKTIQLFLMIVLRRNSFDVSVSPSVLDYTLMTSSSKDNGRLSV